jgi:hypothetical protein
LQQAKQENNMEEIKVKKISFFLFSFFCFYSHTVTEEILAGGNKTILYGFDTSVMKIVSAKKKDAVSAILNSVEIGYFIDNKPIRLIEMNPKVEYINGTPIIKIESSYQKIKVITYILSPIEEKKDSIFIISTIKNSDGKNIKNIKSFFMIDSKQRKSVIKFDRIKNSFLEDKISIRALNNEFDLYFTNGTDYKELKFRKINNSEDEKKDGEHLFFISDTGNIERYGEKKDIVEISISGGDTYNIEEDIKRDIIVDREIGVWEHWHGNLSNYETPEKETKIIKQCMVFLKLAQLADGSVSPSLLKEYDYIKSEEMLLTALAFIKTRHFDETKKILEYISNNPLKSREKFIADYGYEIGKGGEKKRIRGDGEVYSYYIQSLYLYALSEYINESGDIAMLKKEYSTRAKKQADFLISKINDGVVDPDCYIGEIGSESADYYLESSLLTMKALDSFFNICDFYINSKEIKKYKEAANNLRYGISAKFVKNDMIIDNLKTKEILLKNSFVFKENLFEEEVKNKTFEKYKEIYKTNIKENTEREDITENIMFIIASLLSNKQNDYREALERVNNIIMTNGYVIPEYVKTDGKIKKYGVAGIDIKINAMYILMRKIGGKNGVNK